MEELLDKFGKPIEVGSKVVYPTRPGGKGPLQLGYGTVKCASYSDGSIDVDTGTDQGESSRVVVIKRTDRVAVVHP